MIVTVCLNPALDQTTTLAALHPGAVHRALTARTDPGGKGINVSKTIAALGGESLAMAFCGGFAGEQLRSMVQALGIRTDFIRVSGETRTNTKIFDVSTGETTDINQAGPVISAAELALFTSRLFAHVASGDTVVLAGSLPQGVPDDLYNQWITRLKAKGVRVLLDADGDRLKLALSAKPDVIKPNLQELLDILPAKSCEGMSPLSCAVLAAHQLIDQGISLVAISQGADGATMVSADGVLRLPGLAIEPKSTVGAGDAMVAALAYGLDRGLPPEQTYALSLATSAAAAMTEGTQPAPRSLVDSLLTQVQMHRL